MAKFLDKDPYTYEREKKTFLHGLRQYHATKGVQPAMFRTPKVSGRDLDLYMLYSRVTSLGGIVKVTNEYKWDLVCESLGFPSPCSQIAYVIRQLYVRYLEAYEKVHFKGEDDDDSRTKRPHTPISFAYRKELSDKVRQTNGFAMEKCRSSEYDRIVHSLQSGLPNEVDFAINICTLLSNEGKHVIHLEKAPLLIDLLLAHAGVFYEGPGSLRKLYEGDWTERAKRNFVQFWYDTISDREVREVIGPSSKKPDDKRHFKDPELFSVRKLGLSDVEGQRILQIAIIFRNLSFEPHNLATMAAHRTLYRFLLLLSHNNCTMLQQIGMDALTNICSHLVMDSVDYVSTQLMLHTIHKGLTHKDKFVILRSMELIEKLMTVDNNLDTFQRCLEPSVYVRVVTLLTIHDIQLLLGALEVMLVMSEREEPFCTRLSQVHRSIDVLVCLVTLDAQSLGADAFVGIKIVDHAPDGIHHPIVTMGSAHGTATSTPPPPHSTNKANTPPVPPARPFPAASTSSASPTPPPPAPPQGSALKEADMETVACQWLVAHYDSEPEASISNIDIYADYLSSCGKIVGRNILNSSDFMRCVKIVFPTVEGKKTENEAGPQFLIAGIKRRRAPLPWKYQQAGQSAPSPAGQMAASAMIARMAQRHSPSPTVSPSPPPPKGGIFPQAVPQRQNVPLPGQVNGQIPGHIHGAAMTVQNPPTGPSQGQVPGQTGQLPTQVQLQVQGGHAGSQAISFTAANPTTGARALPPPFTQAQLQQVLQQQQQQHQQPQQVVQTQHATNQAVVQHQNVINPQAGPTLMQQQPQQQLNHPPQHQFQPPQPQIQQLQPQLQQQAQQQQLQIPATQPHLYQSHQPQFTPHAQQQLQPQPNEQVQPQLRPQSQLHQQQQPHPQFQQHQTHPQSQQHQPQPSSQQLQPQPQLQQQQPQHHQSQPPLQQHQLQPQLQQHQPQPQPQQVQSQPQQQQSQPEVQQHQPQTQSQQNQPQQQHLQAVQQNVGTPQSGLSQSQPQAGYTSIAVARPPQQQSVPHIPQGVNSVSVADIVAGNMRVPQQHLSYNLQENNSKQLNGQALQQQMQGAGPTVNGPQNFSGTSQSLTKHTQVVSNISEATAMTAQSLPTVVMQAHNGSPSVLGNAVENQSHEHYVSLPGQNGTSQHVQSSDSMSESSTELNSKSRSNRSRSNSGKKSSGRNTPSRQSSSPNRSPGAADKSPKPSAEDAPTEKCQPPLKVPLPDGEVRIEKIPNVHAMGVDGDDDDGDDRTDVTEGIIRQIAGSPVLNQSSCHVPMEESESLVSEVDTNDEEGSQTPDMNGETAPTPEPAQQQLSQNAQSVAPGTLPKQQIGVLSQPQPQVHINHHYQLATNKQSGTTITVGQSQPQPQFVFQQQMPVVSRSVVNVQVQGQVQTGQAILQTQQGTLVQSHSGNLQAGTVVRNAGTGTVIQTQSGSYVQVQPQIQVQGHQAVIQTQPSFQGQQFQAQVPLQVTLVPQGQVQQQVQQQQLNVVSGVPHLQPGQTMIMTTNSQQGNITQATILSQNSGQLVVQNVNGPPRTGPKPILPQPPVSSMPQVQTTQNVQINRLPGLQGLQRLQGPLSPTNRDSPLIKRLLQQGPVHPAPGNTISQQTQLQVIQPQQGQIVLNTVGHSQGAPMTVQTQGQTMPLSHVQVVTHLPTGVSVQTAPTIANIPQIQLHHQPILPALPGSPSPNRVSKEAKSKKSKSKHKKKDKDKDKERDKDKTKNGSSKDDLAKFRSLGGHDDGQSTPGKDTSKKNNYSIHVISEEGDKKVIGVVCNGLPVPPSTESGDCNNSVDLARNRSQDCVAKQGLPNGYIGDTLHNDVKLAKDNFVSPLASKDIESLLKKAPQTIGDKMDSLVGMKRDSAENGILADKLGKPCLNHVVNGDIDRPTVKDNYDGNNTVSDRLDKLLHGAVPNLSQPNIPNTSTPNPKTAGLVAFCRDIRSSFPIPSTVPSVTVGAVANANNNNQQNTSQSVPVTNSQTRDVPQSGSSALNERTQHSANQSGDPGQDANPTCATSSQGMPPANPTSATSTQASLPQPTSSLSLPLTVQVPSPAVSQSPCFKRPIDDVLQSPDGKQSAPSNPLASPSHSAAAPPSPSTPRSTKKRRHSSSSSTSSSSRKSSSSSGKPAPVLKYVCEWKGCIRKYPSAKALHTHTCISHVLSISYRGLCEWEGCDRIQRQRWSVVSHIMDKHCSEQAIQAAIEKRAQRAAQPTPPPSQDPSPQPPPIVYNAHTAYHAIRRSLHTPSLKELLGENEGPVTKSIRLTAALILKNLATHSAVGRREIRKHELLLARLAISNMESSTTLAKCLKELDLDS
ncbi:uncharacterized protein [Diadema antillarum]|uniref:uncharacterized protein n=1 Tax=Diadema antillarum TaxID=105358 RepID=UPI003A88E781